MAIPQVLISFVVRPMCVGLFFRDAFRQAGCKVIVAGPCVPHVYGKKDKTEHVFPQDDFVPPHVELPYMPINAIDVIAAAKADGFDPDLLVMVDQLDTFYLTGGTTPDVPFVHIAVENWGTYQAKRFPERATTREYHMIAHSDEAPLPAGSQWLPFGADPFIHADLNLARDKKVVQIGTYYQPRPKIWNAIRQHFDGAVPVMPEDYGEECKESASTFFGRAPSYRAMAEVYSRGVTCISSSNVDFVPMRAPEAFSFGSVLLSDDVPSMRAAFGAPYPEDPQGIWCAHSRDEESIIRAVEYVCAMPEEERNGIVTRAKAAVFSSHLYYHRARSILRDIGIQGATRMV